MQNEDGLITPQIFARTSPTDKTNVGYDYTTL